MAYVKVCSNSSRHIFYAQVLTTRSRPRSPRDCFLLRLGPEDTEGDVKHRVQVVSDLITSHFHLAFKVLNTYK